MEIRVMTTLNQSVNDEVDLFKYERGRYLALGIALALVAGGVTMIFLRAYGTYFLILGLVLIVVGLPFIFSFTFLWGKTRAKIIANERVSHPFVGQANLLAVFTEKSVTFTLEKPGAQSLSESHVYSDFSGVDVTETYCFFIVGDPKKNPAIPVKKSEELLSFLKKQGVKLRFHKGSVKA